MSDQLDSLFSELADDIEDDGFSEIVIKRIEGPRLARHALSACIYLLIAALILGPLQNLAVLAIGNLEGSLAGLSLPGEIGQNPILLIAMVCAASVPAALISIKE